MKPGEQGAMLLPSAHAVVSLAGSAAALTAEQNHKVDASIHYNIPELQASSRVPLPQQNGQPDAQPPRKGLIPPEHDKDSDSEGEEEDEEEEEDECPRPKWQGIEAIFEAYQEHIEGRGPAPRPRLHCNLTLRSHGSALRPLSFLAPSSDLGWSEKGMGRSWLQKSPRSCSGLLEPLRASVSSLDPPQALLGPGWVTGHLGIPQFCSGD